MTSCKQNFRTFFSRSAGMKQFVFVALILAVASLQEVCGKKSNSKAAFKKLAKKAMVLSKTLAKLERQIKKAEAAVAAQNRHIVGDAADAIIVVDADFSGSACGPTVLTSWTENLDVYFDAGSTTDASGNFASGTFTAQEAGWHHICAFLRFRNSGNSNDVTILKNGGTRLAAFGNAITYDWRSTGTCLTTLLAKSDYIQIKHESGSSSDCVEETTYHYGKFIAHNVGNAA